MKRKLIVTGPFDNIRSRDVRFLQECSKQGLVTVLLWDDESVQRLTGTPSKFPLAERVYFLNSLRSVSNVVAVAQKSVDRLELPKSSASTVWAGIAGELTAPNEKFCRKIGIPSQMFLPSELGGFADTEPGKAPTGRKKVIVTGCYDWLHSGHIRFFEEVSTYGDLYVILGHDANIRTLKGPGHPLQPEAERRYMVASVRYVTRALIASGEGWLDAQPEIERLRPEIYAVNEDGDRGGKREFCAQHGMEYLVLKRTPAPGLPRRSSTALRGY